MRKVDYVYNETTGQRTSFTMKNGSGTTLYSDSYTYNPNLGYLTAADYSNITDGSWTYDASGNRSNSGYTYDELNRMTASPGATYVHDTVGNRTKKTVGTPSLGNYTNIGWDAMNRMIGTESYASNQLTVANQYRYRADGLRTMKILGDEESTVPYEELSSYYDFNYWRNNRTWTYGYDGQMSVLELYKGETHEGNIVQDATRNTLGARGIDMIVAERTWGPSGDPLLYQKRKQYPLYDGHGNMFASIIRGTGNSYQLVNERRYDAWGVTGITSGPGDALANPKEGYCGSIGHKLDPESGLIYMRARYYEPGTGRFISEDPAMDGLNWYVYCGNDPVQKVDTSGRNPLPLAWLIAHGIAAMLGLRLGFAAGALAWEACLQQEFLKRPGAVHDKTDAYLMIYQNWLTEGLAGLVAILGGTLCEVAAIATLGSIGATFGVSFLAGLLTAMYMGLLSSVIADMGAGKD